MPEAFVQAGPHLGRHAAQAGEAGEHVVGGELADR